eukprot:NP_508651.1 Uncharacterized protein CELE_F47B7.6 [Caenorhabditis elegans]
MPKKPNVTKSSHQDPPGYPPLDANREERVQIQWATHHHWINCKVSHLRLSSTAEASKDQLVQHGSTKAHERRQASGRGGFAQGYPTQLRRLPRSSPCYATPPPPPERSYHADHYAVDTYDSRLPSTSQLAASRDHMPHDYQSSNSMGYPTPSILQVGGMQVMLQRLTKDMVSPSGSWTQTRRPLRGTAEAGRKAIASSCPLLKVHCQKDPRKSAT